MCCPARNQSGYSGRLSLLAGYERRLEAEAERVVPRKWERPGQHDKAQGRM